MPMHAKPPQGEIMNKRTRKKILRAGYKHPRFAEAFQEEYHITCKKAGKQIAKVLNIFLEQVRSAGEKVAKFVAEHNTGFNSIRQ
jgi:hypothetical protein